MNDLSEGGLATEERRRAAAPISPKSAREILQPEQVPPPPPRSRAARHPLVVFLNFFLTIAVIAVVAVVGVALFAKFQFDQAGPLDQPRAVQIAAGKGVGDIADELQRQGLISNRWVFRVGVQVYGGSGSLKAGEYSVPAHASMREIMDMMVSGESITYKVSIPEGLTSQQVVQRLMDDPVLTGPIQEVPPEGSLYPDTYVFSRGDTRQAIINQMRRQRDRVLTEVWNRRVADLPISSPEEMVTLASIVEKETGIADERSRVAAVFINRLRRDMRLQSDPTVIYGIFGGAGKPSDRPITRSDLERPTAYNTYQIDGLPPGPIGNPGRASLEAVANPSRTSDLYFVADGTGGHAFAETYADHQRNVARWRLIEARQNQDAAARGAVPAVEESAVPGIDGPDAAPAAAPPPPGAGPAPADGDQPADPPAAN